MSHANFGTDLLLELFSWIPAKGVIKYFSLDRTLSRVLSEPFFHYKQAINSSRSNGGVFLQPETSWAECDKLDFHVVGTEPRSLFDIPKESVSFLESNGRVLASSQGLVLLSKLVRGVAQGFLVCNPVTKSWTRLNIPDELRVIRVCDFGLLIGCRPRKLDGFSEGDFPNDYIVTAPVLVDDETSGWGCSHRLAVYRNGRWEDEFCDLRELDKCQIRLDMPVGVFNGPDKGLVIHYLCDSLPNARRRVYFLEPYVVAYDVERKGSCRACKLPKGAWMEDGDHSKLEIFKWGCRETLGLVRADGRRLTVWELEDYDRMSWRRVLAETTKGMGVPEEEGNVVGCCVVNGKELLFATENQVYSYEMEGPEAGRLEVVGEHGCRGVSRLLFTAYANTFRPVCGEGKRVFRF